MWTQASTDTPRCVPVLCNTLDVYVGKRVREASYVIIDQHLEVSLSRYGSGNWKEELILLM
jgi:hypothetical protein